MPHPASPGPPGRSTAAPPSAAPACRSRGDGTHTVTYSSTDNAGNAEPTRTATVRIDGTAPQASCAEAGRWFKTASRDRPRIAASDTDSGPGQGRVSPRPGRTGSWATSAVVAGAGAHPLSYRVIDVCGNVTTGQCVVGIDTARPKTVKAFASKGKKSGKLDADVQGHRRQAGLRRRDGEQDRGHHRQGQEGRDHQGRQDRGEDERQGQAGREEEAQEGRLPLHGLRRPTSPATRARRRRPGRSS